MKLLEHRDRLLFHEDYDMLLRLAREDAENDEGAHGMIPQAPNGDEEVKHKDGVRSQPARELGNHPLAV
jgi:hypothetical protein